MKYIFHLQLEALVVEMQDPKTGVKGSEQKLNVTTIPHVITGENNTHLNTHQEKRKNKTKHKYKEKRKKKGIKCNSLSSHFL